jgi:hypothetical protein
MGGFCFGSGSERHSLRIDAVIEGGIRRVKEENSGILLDQTHE